jgi:electron transport complex protein RnfG
MNLTTKMIVVLTVLTMVAGGLLSYWDGITSPRIEAYRLEQLKQAIAEVLPDHESYDEVKADGMILYDPEPVGLAFEAIGNGFQGKISIMVGISLDFKKINAIKILEQLETPGLGTKIVEDPSNKEDRFWFPNQFKNLTTEPQIDVVKNIKPGKPNEIQAITGATISSVAMATILNDGIQKATISSVAMATILNDGIQKAKSIYQLKVQ